MQIKIGVEIKDYIAKEHFSKKQLALLDRFSQLGLMAAREAISDSGLTFDGEDGDNTATIIGCGVGGQETADQAYYHIYKEGRRGVHPFTIPRMMLNAACSHITMENGITGPSYAIASACSSANHAIGQAFHMVRQGIVDRAVTGGTEACIAIGTMKGWEAIRVMTTDTCRPFSKNRTGMTLGEGAAIMTLETLEHAKARGAKIYAELTGYGATSDGYDMVAPSGEGAVRCMKMALSTAKNKIDYINTHGTSTPVGDITELKAVGETFKDYKPKISSTKSLAGHSLGATSVHEAIYSLIMMKNSFIAASANITDMDDEAKKYPIVTKVEKGVNLNSVMSNSFGFGGTNATLVFEKV